MGSDDPLRDKKSNLGAKAKAQSRLVGIVKGDITSTRQTEWPAMRCDRRRSNPVRPSDPGSRFGLTFAWGGQVE